jgi:hypothetical protein
MKIFVFNPDGTNHQHGGFFLLVIAINVSGLQPSALY